MAINLNNAINALSGKTLYEQLQTPGYRALFELSLYEAQEVYRRQGIRCGSVGVLTPFRLQMLLGIPQPIFQRLAHLIVKIDRQANSSMQQDLREGRETEILELQGKIVALGEKAGVKTPVARTLMELVLACSSASQLAASAAAGSVSPPAVSPPALSPEEIFFAAKTRLDSPHQLERILQRNNAVRLRLVSLVLFSFLLPFIFLCYLLI